MEWIKCDDEFPEEHQKALLFYPYKGEGGGKSFIIFVGYWNDLHKKWDVHWRKMIGPPPTNSVDEYMYIQRWLDRGMELSKKKVTHWRPLPEIPKN